MKPLLQPSIRPALWSRLCAGVAQTFSPERYGRSGIVIAVSGGADSVALLRLLVDLWDADPRADRGQLIVAHYNHALRGEDSLEDQRFVSRLAESLQLAFVTETHGDQPSAATPTDGAASASPTAVAPLTVGPPPTAGEEALRRRRYDFLSRTVAARGARCVLTAHTADDQVETVLHHLFRGTGPAGLCGIPSHRTILGDFVLIRPLLQIGGSELRAGLKEIGQPWREDTSNAQLDYQRNWIRGELLPQIRSRYSGADQAILRLITAQQQWYQTLRARAAQWIDAGVVFSGDQVRIRRGPVEPSIFALALSLIWDHAGWPRQPLCASHYQRLTELVAAAEPGSLSLPGAIRAEASGDTLVLRRSCASEVNLASGEPRDEHG